VLRRRDVAVGDVAEHVGADGRALVLRQHLQQGRGGRRAERLDVHDVLGIELDALHAQPLPCPALRVPAALRIRELVHRDAEQPRAGGARRGAVPAAPGERRREGLRGQVGRELGVPRPAREEAEHRIDMPRVELLERRGIAGGQKLLVGGGAGNHALPTSRLVPDL
jgi:hypothetical protein